MTITQAHPIAPNTQPSYLRLSARAHNADYTKISIRANTHTVYTLDVTRDPRVASHATPQDITLIASVGNTYLLVCDSYASIPGGMSHCQAGQETFLRVIALKQGNAQEVFKTKLESCTDSIELMSAKEGLAWRPDSATLRIHWLAGPQNKGQEEIRTLKITAAGVTEQ